MRLPNLLSDSKKRISFVLISLLLLSLGNIAWILFGLFNDMTMVLTMFSATITFFYVAYVGYAYCGNWISGKSLKYYVIPLALNFPTSVIPTLIYLAGFLILDWLEGRGEDLS